LTEATYTNTAMGCKVTSRAYDKQSNVQFLLIAPFNERANLAYHACTTYGSH